MCKDTYEMTSETHPKTGDEIREILSLQTYEPGCYLSNPLNDQLVELWWMLPSRKVQSRTFVKGSYALKSMEDTFKMLGYRIISSDGFTNDGFTNGGFTNGESEQTK